MNLYDRYINGDMRIVYDEIHELGNDAFNDVYRKDVEKVLTETFERVSFNLRILHKELENIGYLFKTDCKSNFEKPIHKPLDNTAFLLGKLDSAIHSFGFVPLSLKYFYRIVGGVNFVWNFEANRELMWEMADPIQISSLDSIVEEVTTEYWKEDIQQYVDDKDFGYAFLNLSADDLHKDNISGGQPYALEITKTPTVDARFINEPNETTFINYLRICFENCGFPGLRKSDIEDGHKIFFNKVKPQLKSI